MPEGLEQAAAETSVVSFQSELPQPLQQAMTQFIEGHPNWDQYRLVQAALAGFLVQNGKPRERSPGFMSATCFAGSHFSMAFEVCSRPSAPEH